MLFFENYDQAKKHTDETPPETLAAQGPVWVLPPSPRERAAAPRSRIFPRPIKQMGAGTPEALVDKLSVLAARERVSRSMLLRVLASEFSRALDDRRDWAVNLVNGPLNDARVAQEAGQPISYIFRRKR